MAESSRAEEVWTRLTLKAELFHRESGRVRIGTGRVLSAGGGGGARRRETAAEKVTFPSDKQQRLVFLGMFLFPLSERPDESKFMQPHDIGAHPRGLPAEDPSNDGTCIRIWGGLY